MLKHMLKAGLYSTLVHTGVDRLFRYLNRNSLLVVMYHGVTENSYDPPVWTQLPAATFRRQVKFLREHYSVITLAEVITAIRSGTSLPERAALITFDDGLKNNYSVAFPVLQEFDLPATIFLTVDLIGSDEIFWFDELYLLIQAGSRGGVELTLPSGSQEHYMAGELWEAYAECVESVKRTGPEARQQLLDELRKLISLDRERCRSDFGLLNWDDVRSMEQSGLVSFGIHTATHRILTELGDGELAAEVFSPRKRFAKEVGSEAAAFCFPNGRPGIDFNANHQAYLRSNGYVCAFTTENALFDWPGGDSMGIGRVPAGNDGTSDPDYFRLNASGALRFLNGR